MSKVTQLRPNQDIKQGLLNIAENSDDQDGCTVIMGNEVYHLGCVQ